MCDSTCAAPSGVSGVWVGREGALVTTLEAGLWRDLLGRGVQVLHQYGSSEYELEAALIMRVVEKMKHIG